MRKLIAIFFVSIFLSSSTQFIEVLKLPLLIEHYFEHKAENKNITFIDFIKLHYAENTHYASHHKDKELPFKAFHQGNCISIALLKTDINITIVNSKVPTVPLKHNSFYSSQFLSYYTASIWQPPKNIV